MKNVIQRIVLPNFAFGAPEEMYVRVANNWARILPSQATLEFDKGGRMRFDTFFNSITVGTWKQQCDIERISLTLKGSGRFIIRFGLYRLENAHRWLDEQIIEIAGEAEIPLEFWGQLSSGMLYFSVEALTEGVITGGYFSADSAPTSEVKLGVVITHFNRKQYVIPAIKRIRDELLNDPLYRDKIELIVVDNSQNIESEEAQGITLIPNKNLGGSGGFARGLLHLKDEGSFTHCLFMDDDASCEVESIRRAYTLLSYAKDDKTAVSGGLLREVKPSILHEKGARYKRGNWTPLKSGMNMSNTGGLLRAELNDQSPNYGAWWFFAFPITHVKHFPFPFFVRGDDVLFGLQNEFNIATLNGIACWGEDFCAKEGPFTRYFGFRGTAIVGILTGSATRKNLFKQFSRWFLESLLSYNYASAKAINWAMQDVLKGPDFFIDNLDTSAIRKRITEIAGVEATRSHNVGELGFEYCETSKESFFRRCGRYLTLNGLLIPSGLMKEEIVFQNKTFSGILRQIFGYKKVYYEYKPQQIGYIVEHDKAKLFAGLRAYVATSIAIFTTLNAVNRQYNEKMDYMTSEQFWRNIYSDSLSAWQANKMTSQDLGREESAGQPYSASQVGSESKELS